MADFDRFRSFAERYVIERASSFTAGKEREDAWAATLDAKSIYQSIGVVAKTTGDVEDRGLAAQAVGYPQGGMAHNPQVQQAKLNVIRTRLPPTSAPSQNLLQRALQAVVKGR